MARCNTQLLPFLLTGETGSTENKENGKKELHSFVSMLLKPAKHSSALFPVWCTHSFIHLQNLCRAAFQPGSCKGCSEGTYEEKERGIQRTGLPCSPYTDGYQGQSGRCRKGLLLEFKGLAKFYRTARCDLENPTERVGMPSIGKL